MKLTNVLFHAKPFWWGKHWNNVPRKWNRSHPNLFRKQWRLESRRPIEEIKQDLPVGITSIDAAEYIKNVEKVWRRPFLKPWPINDRPLKCKFITFKRCRILLITGFKHFRVERGSGLSKGTSAIFGSLS